MKRLACIILAALCWPALVHAQAAQIEALLERQLSAEGRIVEIDGFTGALSAQAQMERLRISDDAGLWLQLEGVVLDWDRAALLRGRLDVNALTAERLQVLRAPAPAPGVPSTQASGFRVPDLPIAIRVDRFALDRVELGAPLLGTALTARLEASAGLDDTGLDLQLLAERTDRQAGQIDLDLRFVRTEETLRVALRVAEPGGGVLAEALDLPDRPSVDLTIAGAGPLDAFAADLTLATDGAQRLGGDVTIRADGTGRAFGADISGDIRPLLQTDTRAFFGPQTRLAVSGLAEDDGALTFDDLSIHTAQFRADGRLRLDGDGAPERLDFTLDIQGDGPVRLPGTAVELDRAALTLGFDAGQGPDWRLSGRAEALAAGGIAAGVVDLDGAGQITPGAGTPFDGTVRATARGVDAPGDPALTALIGPDLTLRTDVQADADGTVMLRGLTRQTPQGTARGLLDVTPTDGRVRITADVAADVPALAPFADLAGLPLVGALSADLTADAELPGGAIALTLTGQSQGLDIGQPRLEALITPDTRLDLAVRRDAEGTRIERLTLDNSALSARVSGAADEADGSLALTATVRDMSSVDPRLTGPADITATLSDLQDTAALVADLQTGFGLGLQFDGQLAGPDAALRFDGALQAVDRFVPVLQEARQLRGTFDLAGAHPSVDAALRAQPGVMLHVNGPVSGPGALLRFDAQVDELGAFVPPLPGPASATGMLDLSTATPTIDATVQADPAIEARVAGPLGGAEAALSINATIANLGALVAQLPGPASLEATLAELAGDQEVSATLLATGLRSTVTGRITGPNSGLDVQARLDSLSRLAPGLTGGASLSAAVGDLEGATRLSAALRTDSGATADIVGRIGLDGGPADLRMEGRLPLGLAAPFAGNRALSGAAQFDLQLAGPLALSSVTGLVQVQDGRVFDPDLGVTVSGLAATAQLRGARADLRAGGAVNAGTLAVTGGVDLVPPYATDIEVNVAELIYALDGLVRTRVGAALTLSGPAQQRLAIGGTVDLFDTEVRVPDTGLGGATPIPPIRHVGASPAATQTRRRAGAVANNATTGAGVVRTAVPLDIRITARDPIFVRGRGLDAAFDGGVQLRGTARAPEPVGQFALQRGRLDFLGRRLDLTEGAIVAAGSAIPRLRVVAQSVLDDLTARITVEGPANAPDISISATPDLPQDEVLARLLFGRSIDTLSPFQVARLVASVRTLAGGRSGLLEATRQRLNFDNLDIRTDATTGATELAIGQRLGEDVYSEVEVDSKGEVQLNLNLDIGTNTRLRGSVTNDGDTGVGIFWERDYD